MVRARSCLPRKLKQCNNCGRIAERRSGTNCKRWCKEEKRQKFCGTMRVVRSGEPNIIRMGEKNGNA